MTTETLPNGTTITSQPRSSDYDFAARAASELSEVEKHALIEYLMETIMEDDETGEGETIFGIMNTGASLLGGKMAYFGPEDISDQAANLGIQLNDDQVATFRNDVRWEELGDTMSEAGMDALRDMVANPCEDIYEVDDESAPQAEAATCRHCGAGLTLTGRGDYVSAKDGGDVCGAATGDLMPGSMDVVTHSI